MQTISPNRGEDKKIQGVKKSKAHGPNQRPMSQANISQGVPHQKHDNIKQ